MIGITSAGAYLPRMRLQRSAIAAANAWFDPSLRGLSKGERTMCNWDEDPITMAVSAAQDCQADGMGAHIDAVYFASTSAPFIDRQNAGVIAEALSLGSGLRTMDVGGSRRDATSATLAAIDMVRSNPGGNVLITAAENRRALVGSPLEMIYGDGAAAVSIGSEGVIAEFVTAYTHAEDFVDQVVHAHPTLVKKTAKKASSTITVKIAWTTALVVRLPTSSELPRTCMPW